jgi:hypothetical protein
MFNYCGVSGTSIPREQSWLHRRLDFFHTPGDDDPDDTGNAGDPDGSDQDEDDMYPIVPHDNTVPRGTLDFFQEQVKGRQDKVRGSAYSTRETQHVGLVLEYVSVTSL